MNYTITTTFKKETYAFLKKESKRRKSPLNKILEEWISYYKKQQLENDIAAWMQERYQEYKDINSEFSAHQLKSIKGTYV